MAMWYHLGRNLPIWEGDARMRDFLKIYLPAALLIFIAFLVAWRFVNPAPPRTIRLAAGPEQGAYLAAAERYRALLAKDGITLNVQVTSGAVQNLQLLQAGQVDVAFMQGGVAAAEPRELMGLASVFFEPLWMFMRTEAPVLHLADLKGRRIAAGVDGSGTQALVRHLLTAAGMADTVTLRPIGGDDAVQALLAGTVDAATFVTARPLPQLGPLLHAQGIRLMSWAQADALAQQFPFLSVIVLPEGRLDLAANLPRQNVQLVAPAAALIAGDTLHPALVDELIRVATVVHGPSQLFGESGQFPGARFLDVPLSPDAGRYLKTGPSFLRRHLSFWAATLAERFLVLLIPILTLVVPLVRFAPPIYHWQVRRRITRPYRALHRIEIQAAAARTAAERAHALTQFQNLEASVEQLNIPSAYADGLYLLRTHIRFIRQSIEKGTV